MWQTWFSSSKVCFWGLIFRAPPNLNFTTISKTSLAIGRAWAFALQIIWIGQSQSKKSRKIWLWLLTDDWMLLIGESMLTLKLGRLCKRFWTLNHYPELRRDLFLKGTVCTNLLALFRFKETYFPRIHGIAKDRSEIGQERSWKRRILFGDDSCYCS